MDELLQGSSRVGGISDLKQENPRHGQGSVSLEAPIFTDRLAVLNDKDEDSIVGKGAKNTDHERTVHAVKS